MTKVVLSHKNAVKAIMLAKACHTSVNMFVNALIENVDPEKLLKAVDDNIALLNEDDSNG